MEPPKIQHNADKRLWLGVDPGLDGAIALIRGQNQPEIWPVPTLKIGGRRGRDYDDLSLFGLLRSMGKAVCYAVIEKQQAFPGQGISSAFRLGLGYGVLRMALTACSIPWHAVSPRGWKNVMLAGLPKAQTPKQRKEQSILVAHRLFPKVSLKRTVLCGVDDHNFAEALLLAEYARRTYAGSETQGR